MPDPYTGVIVGAFLDPMAAAALAIPGYEPPEHLHITLAYYGDADQLTDLQIARLLTDTATRAGEYAPLEGKVAGLGRFQAPDPTAEGAQDVLYAVPDIVGLAGLRQAIADCGRGPVYSIAEVPPPRPASEHGWTPHITLAYLDPSAPAPIEEAPPVPLRIAALTVAIAGKRIEIPLTGHMVRESVATEQVEVTEALQSHVIEGNDADGGRVFDVILITAGMSKNGRLYPAAALQRATALFEGVACYADHARPGTQRSVRDKVGVFSQPEYGAWTVDGAQVEGIKARLTAVDPWLRETLNEALAAGRPDFVGFSIDAIGHVAKTRVGDRLVDCMESFVSVRSVDCVAEPAAGGRLVRVVESTAPGGSAMTPEEIKALVAEGLKESLPTLIGQVQEAIAPKADEPKATPATATSDGKTPEQIIQEARDAARAEAEAVNLKAERRMFLTEQLAMAKLSAQGKERIRVQFQEALTRRIWEESELTNEIAGLLAYEASLVQENANPTGLGAPSPFIVAGRTSKDQMHAALAGWFAGSKQDEVTPFRSLQEAYCAWEGVNPFEFNAYDFIDSMNTINYQGNRSRKRVQESLTTSSWGQVFADVAYLMMLREYQALPYDGWRKFVSEFDHPTDFRTRHWARVGGYGDIPTVGEGAPYQPLTTPGDEEVTFSVAKKGGLDDFTWEAILGDRVNKVRQLPKEMAYSAKRTLYKFVMNLITTDNPTMPYDSVAMYHATHGNLGSSALSVSSFSSVKQLMRDQTRALASSEILGPRNAPKYIIVPNELEDLAARIFNPSQGFATNVSNAGTDTTLDPRAHAGKGYEVVVYDELTDANDWYVVADPTLMNTVVMGFLAGQEEPELFVQDDPKSGSTFSSEKITWKCRHVYGGAVADHRAFYKQAV